MSDYVFFGNQDLGALGYDAWKTDVPEYYGYDGPDCDHEDFEIDYNGRATCDRCGAHWSATKAECDAYDRAQAMAAEAWDRMERRERLMRPLRAIAWHLWGRWLPRPKIEADDEIPF